jgi:GNAT superfamily N-acetyltransferase
MKFRLIEPEDIAETIDVRAASRESSFSREELRQLGITEESTGKLLSTTHRGFLCEEEDRIVGVAMGDGETGELWVIAVLPEYEGRGVGSQLLALVEEWLWSLGWKEIWLWTSSDPMKRASHFYLNRGWYIHETKGGILYMKKDRPATSPELAEAYRGASEAESSR